MPSNNRYWISKHLLNKIKTIREEQLLSTKAYTKEDEIAVTREIDRCRHEYEKNGFIYGQKLS